LRRVPVFNRGLPAVPFVEVGMARAFSLAFTGCFASGCFIAG